MAAPDPDEWKKLPTDEKCVHKQWKARVAGYEEALKLFNTLDEKSSEFTKYLGVLKHIAVDNNALAQEKGLDTVLAFVENAHCAGRSVGETLSAVLSKCINSPKTKTREKALEIILMYIEIDKPQPVQEELMKGLTNKQPKIVLGCINAFRNALEQFGPSIIPIKPLVKVLPKLLEDRDKNVREEAKQLTISIYKWIGAALTPQLANLKPVQVQELEAEFSNLPPGKPTQTRFMRSQQDLKEKAEAAAAGGDNDDDDDDGTPAVEIDPLDLMEPVEILSKLPKVFYEQIEAKKWQERKEMLEAVERLAANPKLLPGEYGDLVRALKKVVSKDTNVMLVALAGNCLCGIAKGLRKKFSPYAVQCVDSILAKFKEKKPMVVTALRDAIDAIYVSTTLEAITESLLEALNDKNPQVKAETASFIARCFTKATTTSLTKKILKPLIAPLVKMVNDMTPAVREASFDALGTAMKVVSEKVMSGLMGEIDPLKMTKIKESCDAAELVNVKGKAGKPAAAAAKPLTAKSASAKPETSKPATVKPGAKPQSARSAGKSAGGKKAPAKKAAAAEVATEALLSDEVVIEKSNALLGEENVKNLSNNNWKERLAAMENIEQEIRRTAKDDMPTQAVARMMGTVKPGLKDTNFQVLKIRLAALTYLAENFKFSWTSAECMISDLVDKIGDVKNGQGCKDVLTAISEATDFGKVAAEVTRLAFEAKNPKNQAESLNWLSQGIFDFGFKVNVKSMIANMKKGLGATNPAVRQSTITLLGVCYMYMGATLRTLFEDEKPALLTMIDAEFDKVKGQKPPAPSRGGKGAGESTEAEGEEEEEVPVEDLLPRADISEKITDALIEKLGDKNWKIRKEGLEEVKTILNEAKFITANIGGLPEALKLRLADSNKILVNVTIDICKTIAAATGPSAKRHVSIIATALVTCLGDSKPLVRKAVCDCLDVWIEQTKLHPFIEDGVFMDCLKLENPNLRSTLLGWLSEKLKDNQKKLPAELKECVPQILTCLNDRNPDVRKNAQDALLPFMIHTGFDCMLKAASKLDKSSKDSVIQLLEKTKADLPAKPVKVKSTPVVQSHVSMKAAEGIMNDDEPEEQPAAQKPAAKSSRKSVAGRGKGKTVGARSSSASRAKGAPVDSTPLMTNAVTKSQRLKDEKNLKILKWNFTQPRKEYFDQLYEQMEKNFSASVYELMSHKDFQKHIKAIQMLQSTLEQYRAETIANIDIILRWFTLRFFETNPSMLNKALEYLVSLFEMLKEENYQLTDNEANSFLPYLILKIGENKENVRREVRKLLSLVCLIYPAAKVFMFVMGGLASKNAKQRTECLEELGLLMSDFGLGVCQPSPKEAIKEIAKQIADRDNPVRSAALNTIVIAHQIMGDQVYKMVGRLSDKDLGMLEERIKRASRSKPIPTSVQVTPQKPGGAPRQSIASQTVIQTSSNGGAPGTITKTRPSTAQVRQEVNEQGDLPEEFRITTSWNPDLTMPEIVDIDYQRIDQLIAEPVTFPRLSETALGRYTTAEADLEFSGDAVRLREFYIENISNDHPQISSSALRSLEAMVKNDSSSFLPHSEMIVTQCITQMKQLAKVQYKYYGKDACYENQTLIDGILLQLAERDLLLEVSVHTFEQLLYRCSSTILMFDETEQGVEAVQTLSYMLSAVLDKGNKTNTLVAALRHLKNVVYSSHRPLANETFPEKFLELSLKCAYKCIRGCNNTNMSAIHTDPLVDECNSFHKNYPKSFWDGDSDEMPRKTVRTVISLLAQHLPAKLMASMTRPSFRPCEDFESVVRKFLNKNGHKLPNTGADESLRKLNQTMSSHLDKTSLAPIFTKMTKQETRDEGLMELYLYKQKFPNADIEPSMKKCSPEFRKFLDDMLQRVALKQKNKAVVLEKGAGDNVISEQENTVGHWEEKIRKLNETVSKSLIMVNKANTTENSGAPSDAAVNNRMTGSPHGAPPDVVLSTSIGMFNKENYPAQTEERPTAAHQESIDASHSQLLELKARLDRIKQRNNPS